MTHPLHKVLIIGVGSIGERHLRCFLATERVEASIFEINAERRQTMTEQYKVRAFATLDEALVEPPQIAIVAVPAHRHVELAIPIAERGIHLLIEKPLSTTLDGIDRLKQTVQQRGLVAGVAYVYRCHPLLTAMRY